MPAALVPPDVLAKTVMLPMVPGAFNPGRIPAVQVAAVEQETPVKTSFPLLSTNRVLFEVVANPVPVMVHVPWAFDPAPPYATSKLVMVGTTLVIACAPTSAVARITAALSRRSTLMELHLEYRAPRARPGWDGRNA